MSAQPREPTDEQRPPFRADHVGSFLRPKYLLAAREASQPASLPPRQLREVEDRAIREIVTLPAGSGTARRSPTGSFAARYFHVDFLMQLDGVVEKGGIPVKFHKADGEIDFAPPVMQVTDKVRRSRPDPAPRFRIPAVRDRPARRSHHSRPRPCCTFAAAAAPSAARPTRIFEQFYADVASGVCAGDRRSGGGRLHLPAARRHQPRLPVRPQAARGGACARG